MAVVHLIFAVRILMSNPCLHVACDQLHGLNIFVGSKLFPFPSGFCFFARSAAFPSFRLCAISIFSPLCLVVVIVVVVIVAFFLFLHVLPLL